MKKYNKFIIKRLPLSMNPICPLKTPIFVIFASLDTSSFAFRLYTFRHTQASISHVSCTVRGFWSMNYPWLDVKKVKTWYFLILFPLFSLLHFIEIYKMLLEVWNCEGQQLTSSISALQVAWANLTARFIPILGSDFR